MNLMFVYTGPKWDATCFVVFHSCYWVSVNKLQQYLQLSKHGHLQHVGISNVQLTQGAMTSEDSLGALLDWLKVS